jgi:hypothetical protein
MKRKLIVLLTTGVLVSALFTGLTIARAQSTNSVAPPAGAGSATAGALKRHPAMVRAIQALLSARQDLQNTKHDFGGHRKDALEACTKAIAELELALKSDKE